MRATLTTNGVPVGTPLVGGESASCAPPNYGGANNAASAARTSPRPPRGRRTRGIGGEDDPPSSWRTTNDAKRRSHAKHAERRLRDRRVQRSRDAEREHASRVERVDDAVVPQARGRVVRVALRLVLRADLVAVGV